MNSESKVVQQKVKVQKQPSSTTTTSMFICNNIQFCCGKHLNHTFQMHDLMLKHVSKESCREDSWFCHLHSIKYVRMCPTTNTNHLSKRAFSESHLPILFTRIQSFDHKQWKQQQEQMQLHHWSYQLTMMQTYKSRRKRSSLILKSKMSDFNIERDTYKKLLQLANSGLTYFLDYINSTETDHKNVPMLEGIQGRKALLLSRQWLSHCTWLYLIMHIK